MAIDIHPAIVHIPVAFLAVYAVFEMVRFKRILTLSFWEPVKGIMLFVGTLGALAALLTGTIAKAVYVGTPTMPLVLMHELFGYLTTLYFGALSLLYLSHFAKDHLKNRHITRLTRFLDSIFDRVLARWPAILIGIVGLSLITIVGALGGAIAYGPDADPMVSFVYHLFF